MKTNILRFSAVLLVSATLFSCGGSGKSVEEIQAEAQTKFDEAQVELTEEAATNCESNMAAYATAALDSLKMAN
jgi:hypothetical protein